MAKLAGETALVTGATSNFAEHFAGRLATRHGWVGVGRLGAAAGGRVTRADDPRWPAQAWQPTRPGCWLVGRPPRTELP